MTLSNLSNDDLVLKFEKLVCTERKVMHLVLLYIGELEARKAYAPLGYDGMYSYLTKGLGYSEASAYRRLNAARLLRKVPELATSLEGGTLNISQLAQVQKGLKSHQAMNPQKPEVSVQAIKEVLKKIENQSSFETQRTISKEMDLPLIKSEKVTPQKDDSVRLDLYFSKEQFKELETSKYLLSHVCVNGTWSEVMAELASKFNKQKQGTKLATIKSEPGRQENRKVEHEDTSLKTSLAKRPEQPKTKPQAFSQEGSLQDSAEGGPHRPQRHTNAVVEPVNRVQTTKDLIKDSQSPLPESRNAIPLAIKRSLLKKADYTCQYVSAKSGVKCTARGLLEIDHIKPISLGGTNDEDNLRVYCRSHNSLAAREGGLFQPAQAKARSDPPPS